MSCSSNDGLHLGRFYQIIESLKKLRAQVVSKIWESSFNLVWSIKFINHLSSQLLLSSSGRMVPFHELKINSLDLRIYRFLPVIIPNQAQSLDFCTVQFFLERMYPAVKTKKKKSPITKGGHVTASVGLSIC